MYSDPKCPKPKLASNWSGSQKGKNSRTDSDRERHANITQLSTWAKKVKGMHDHNKPKHERQHLYDLAWSRNLHAGKVAWGTLGNNQLCVKPSKLFNHQLQCKIDRGLIAKQFYPPCPKDIFGANKNPTMHDILVTCKASVVTEYTGSLLVLFDDAGVQLDHELTHKASFPSQKGGGAGVDLSMDALQQSKSLVWDGADGCFKPGVKKYNNVHVPSSLADPLSGNKPTQKRVVQFGPTIDPSSIHWHMGLGGIANSSQDLKVPYNCRPAYVQDEVFDRLTGDTHTIVRLFLVASKPINIGDEILWKYFVKYSRFDG